MSSKPNITHARILPNGDAIIGTNIYKIVKPEVLANIVKLQNKVHALEQAAIGYQVKADELKARLLCSQSESRILRERSALECFEKHMDALYPYGWNNVFLPPEIEIFMGHYKAGLAQGENKGMLRVAKLAEEKQYAWFAQEIKKAADELEGK